MNKLSDAKDMANMTYEELFQLYLETRVFQRCVFETMLWEKQMDLFFYLRNVSITIYVHTVPDKSYGQSNFGFFYINIHIWTKTSFLTIAMIRHCSAFKL